MIYWTDAGQLAAAQSPPPDFAPIYTMGRDFLAAQTVQLHRSMSDWAATGLSPGLIVQDRVWCSPEGRLAFHFSARHGPQGLTHVGLARELAAWLVLLGKWVDTSRVVTQARAVWPMSVLAGALTFTTPAFLPKRLVEQHPDNWERIALALSAAMAGGSTAERKR